MNPEMRFKAHDGCAMERLATYRSMTKIRGNGLISSPTHVATDRAAQTPCGGRFVCPPCPLLRRSSCVDPGQGESGGQRPRVTVGDRIPSLMVLFLIAFCQGKRLARKHLQLMFSQVPLWPRTGKMVLLCSLLTPARLSLGKSQVLNFDVKAEGPGSV